MPETAILTPGAATELDDELALDPRILRTTVSDVSSAYPTRACTAPHQCKTKSGYTCAGYATLAAPGRCPTC